MFSRFVAGLIAIALAWVPLLAGAQASQPYPSKSIRLVVPYPAGGIADTFARSLAQGLGSELGQTVIVENKPGGNQIIGAEAVLQAPPDGYTLFLGSMTSLATNLGVYKKLPYDPIRSFAPISELFSTPLFLTVSPRVTAQSVRDLVSQAKAAKVPMTYATLGEGGSLHLAGELFQRAAGIRLERVPYKGSVPAVTDLLGGHVDMIFDAGITVIPHAKAGKVRILAVTGHRRVEVLASVPTMAEAGYGAVDIGVWFGLVARAGTPSEVVARLSAAVNRVLADAAFSRPFVEQGLQVSGSTPEAFAAFIRKEAERWPAFIRDIGVSPQ